MSSSDDPAGGAPAVQRSVGHRRSTRRTWLVGQGLPLALGLVAGAISWWATRAFLPYGVSSDVRLYARYADAVFAGDIPYRDVSIEYPPGALVPMLLPRLFGSGAYVAAFEATMAVSGFVLLAAAGDLLGRLGTSFVRRAVVVGLLGATPLLLGAIVLERFDLFPAALVAAALAAQVRGRLTVAAVLLGIATAAKVYPVVLLPLLAVHALRRAGRAGLARVASAFGVAFAVVVVPVAAFGGTETLRPLRLLLDRPLQIESTGAALLHVAHQVLDRSLGVEVSYGSTNLGGGLPHLVAIVFGVLGIAAVAVVTLLVRRAPLDPATIALGAATMLVATVVTGKVLSPQYLIWLVPVVAVVPGRLGIATGTLLGAAAVVTNAYFPRRYPDLEALDPLATWLLVGRDALLVLLAAVLVAALVRRVRAGGPPPGPGSPPADAAS